jgi:ElaB/YqjD/DUF883 family membrane-anchored ribosome-binding protein
VNSPKDAPPPSCSADPTESIEVIQVPSKRPQQAGPEPSDDTHRDADELPELEAAEEAVRQAKEQLREARRAYWQVRRQAVEQLKQLREMSVGEVVDGTLKRVKRYPGPSLLVAVVVGFFLGKLFRR